MYKRNAMYGIAALIAAACIFSACSTGNDDPPPAPTPDTAAPVLQAITANGFEVVLAYNETLNAASVPAPGDFTLAVLGGSIDSVAISGRRVVLTLTESADDGNTSIELDYTAGTNPIKDSAGNAAANLDDEGVTNVTLAEPTYNGTPTTDGQFKVESVAGDSTGETKLTFTWVSTSSYGLQYILVANGVSATADGWIDVTSGAVADSILATDTTDDVWVRFIDGDGNVSAPVVKADLTITQES